MKRTAILVSLTLFVTVGAILVTGAMAQPKSGKINPNQSFCTGLSNAHLQQAFFEILEEERRDGRENEDEDQGDLPRRVFEH